jgi:hypothetical protein
LAWGYPYYLPAEPWFLSRISPFSDEVIPNPSLHWFTKLQRLGLEYQQFVPYPPYPKILGSWPQFKVQMPETLRHAPPFGTVKVKVPGHNIPGWKQWAPPIRMNMRYFPLPSGVYVISDLTPDQYAEIEALRPQREIELGSVLPRVVPASAPSSWKRPELRPRSLGAASVAPFPVKSQWGDSEQETEIAWINSNWMQYQKPPKHSGHYFLLATRICFHELPHGLLRQP